MPRYRDDLMMLPAEERPWKPDRRGVSSSEEHTAIFQALHLLAKHAVEAGDRRMAGLVLAASALSGVNVAFVWQDCSNLFDTDLPYDTGGTQEQRAEQARARGADLDEQARAFFVSGVRRRPRVLLRAEARGLLWGLAWLHRIGLLNSRDMTVADSEPWRRKNGLEGQLAHHPNILGPLPPAAATLN